MSNPFYIRYKALKARRAELSTVLSKLSRDQRDETKLSPASEKALEVKLQEVERSIELYRVKLDQVDSFASTLDAEIAAQETLVQKTRSDVNKVSYNESSPCLFPLSYSCQTIGTL